MLPPRCIALITKSGQTVSTYNIYIMRAYVPVFRIQIVLGMTYTFFVVPKRFAFEQARYLDPCRPIARGSLRQWSWWIALLAVVS